MECKEITIVVQGGISPLWTPLCLRSIRAVLPGASIVLSTQKGNDLSCVGGLYDKLVLSDDDAFVFCNEALDAQGQPYPMKKQNMNRQIMTTLAGLRAVETPFAMKLRSDMVIDGNGFLNAWRHYNEAPDDPQRRTEGRFVKDRIVVGCHTTRFAKSRTLFKHYRCPFNISDFMMFGRTEDLRALWDIPTLAPEEAFFFKDADPFFTKNWGYRIKTHMRLLPEQYIWTQFLKKFGREPMRWFFDNRPEVVAFYEEFLAKNLIVLSQDKLQISLPQRATRYVHRYFDFTTEDWLCLYARYCLNETRPWPAAFCAVRRFFFLALSLPQIWAGAALNLPFLAKIKKKLRT